MKNKLLVISAVWCPSCLILNKNLTKLKEIYPNLEIKKLDYDLDEEEVAKYNIGKILPVIIKKVDGEEKRLIGEKSFEEIKEFVGDIV